jgi:hypothetical protein
MGEPLKRLRDQLELSIFLELAGLLLGLSDADVYLHNPRGSNNRLNGNGADRTNNNRLFDSQVSFKSPCINI